MEQAKGFAAPRRAMPARAAEEPDADEIGGPPDADEDDAGEDSNAAGGDFERPDIAPLIPKGQEDAVARIVAAGMKIMYAPESRPEVETALKQGNVPQALAMNVTGLILTLDQKSQGGLPVQAIFPAAVELLGEATEVFSAAGKPVSQSDYADAARLMMVLLAKKMGATDEQIMGEVQKHVPGAALDDGGEGLPAPDEGMGDMA